MRLLFLSVSFFVLLLLLGLFLLGLEHYLFWRMIWFDVPLHFLGGLGIGFFVGALAYHFRPRIFVFMTASAILLWEAYEYLFGMPRENNYFFDTSLDILMGALGALVAYIILRFSLWHSR